MLDETHGHDGVSRVTSALTDIRRRLADTEDALRTGTPDPDAVSAVVAGMQDVTTALAGLVQAVMNHAPTLAHSHGEEVSTEVLADLRALHRCLNTGSLLLAPALDDLRVTAHPARRDRRSVMSLDKPWNDVADQLRPAQPDLDLSDDQHDGEDAGLAGVIEADPADVADQRRVVPLHDDQPWP